MKAVIEPEHFCISGENTNTLKEEIRMCSKVPTFMILSHMQCDLFVWFVLGYLGIQKETEASEDPDAGWGCEDGDGGRLQDGRGAPGDYLQQDR